MRLEGTGRGLPDDSMDGAVPVDSRGTERRAGGYASLGPAIQSGAVPARLRIDASNSTARRR